MTSSAKPITRKTEKIYRSRPLIVTLKAFHLEMREYKRRDTLCVDYATLYEFALKLRWRQQQAEKGVTRRRR